MPVKTSARIRHVAAELPARSKSYVWRRLHGGRAIAEVSRLRGMGHWLVSAFPSTHDGRIVRIARAFSMLTDAQQAADLLVSENFDHTCRTGECGRWLRWPETADDFTP